MGGLSMSNRKWVVVTGTSVHGPFESRLEASNWAVSRFGDEEFPDIDWQTTELHSTDNGSPADKAPDRGEGE